MAKTVIKSASNEKKEMYVTHTRNHISFRNEVSMLKIRIEIDSTTNQIGKLRDIQELSITNAPIR